MVTHFLHLLLMQAMMMHCWLPQERTNSSRSGALILEIPIEPFTAMKTQLPTYDLFEGLTTFSLPAKMDQFDIGMEIASSRFLSCTAILQKLALWRSAALVLLFSQQVWIVRLGSGRERRTLYFCKRSEIPS
mmetsp:Transcript_35768/g.103014  ORF Transcript_35768/g.103014 Transcript_35768/m.103014 type:complete len:132 (-) Transcript_35768:497-892(-)